MPAKRNNTNARRSTRNAGRQTKANTYSEPKQDTLREAAGTIIICLGLLSSYFALTSDATGFAGVIRSIMLGLAGKLCLCLPVIIIWVGIIVAFSGRQKKASPGRIALIASMLLIIFGAVEIFFVEDLLMTMRQTHFANFLLEAFRAQTGSGLLGALTAWPLYMGLGLRVPGSLIVYISLFVVVLILLRKINLHTIRDRAADRFANVQQHMEERREVRAERREARIERQEAERLARAQQLVIPKADPNTDNRREKRAAAEAEDAFSAKQTVVSSEPKAYSRKVEVVDQPTPSVHEDHAAEREKDEEPAAFRALKNRKAAAAKVETAPEDDVPPFDPADDLFDGRAQEPFPGAFAGNRGKENTEHSNQTSVSFDFTEETPVVYESAIHTENDGEAAIEDEDDFILPSPDDFDAEPELKEEDYVPGSRLIEKEHVYKHEPAQPLSSYSEEKEMRAPIHTDMLVNDEDEEPDTQEVPKKESLFGDRVRRANSAYDAHKATQNAPERKQTPVSSPFGGGLASGPENVPFSQNPIFGVQKPAAPAVPEPPQYNYPPVDLLAQAKPSKLRNQESIDMEKGRKLVEVLLSFGITTKLTGVSHGPTVTRFELAPAPGIKVSRITSLVDDIALGLAAKSVRIEAPIPGKPAVGVEVPNDEIETVPLRDVLESGEAQKHPSRVAAAIGRDNGGRNIICDLAKMPHILIAGATGAGKSVCINCIICSILYRATPEEVRLIMIDPKMVELSVYNDIPHLLVPVVTDPKKAAGALEWVVNEMTQRYRKFAASGTKDIKGYNLKRPEGEPAMPQIVVIIDELADLMMVAPGDVEDAICRIAQLARAAGIHLVIATQRPSVNVITGVIKANIPSRIAFTVASQVDSRTILDIGGAEKLLGRGDMLYAPSGTNKPQRVQGAWISENEVQAVVQYIRDRHEADYSEDLAEHLERADMSDAEKEEAEEQHDDLLPQAIEFVVDAGQASISMLQRKMRIGYARAGRLIDEMSRRGIISEADGAKPREVLITRDQFRAMFREE